MKELITQLFQKEFVSLNRELKPNLMLSNKIHDM